MPGLKRVANILKYGVGSAARERKQADKARVRKERFLDAERWEHGEAFARRRYDSYDEYVSHQAAKLDQIAHRLRETEDDDFVEFKRRFETCEPLGEARSVLCLGARLGTEVRALHALGHFAIGIDLNPGADNAYVLPGDFHAIVFPDGSIDAVYTNALDHVFELDKVVGEVHRVLRDDGLFVIDMMEGFGEDNVPGNFESILWHDCDAMIERICKQGGFVKVEARDLGHHRRDAWMQTVLRKPAADASDGDS